MPTRSLCIASSNSQLTSCRFPPVPYHFPLYVHQPFPLAIFQLTTRCVPRYHGIFNLPRHQPPSPSIFQHTTAFAWPSWTRTSNRVSEIGLRRRSNHSPKPSPTPWPDSTYKQTEDKSSTSCSSSEFIWGYCYENLKSHEIWIVRRSFVPMLRVPIMSKKPWCFRLWMLRSGKNISAIHFMKEWRWGWKCSMDQDGETRGGE